MYFLVIEGIYLRQLNLSPFVGSIVHEVCRRTRTSFEMIATRERIEPNFSGSVRLKFQKAGSGSTHFSKCRFGSFSLSDS